MFLVSQCDKFHLEQHLENVQKAVDCTSKGNKAEGFHFRSEREHLNVEPYTCAG